MKNIAKYAGEASASAPKGLKNRFSGKLAVTLAFPSVLLLSACAVPVKQASLPHYRCEHSIEFSVNFVDDSAVLNGSGGQDVLYRNAGGQGEMQRFYSNPRMRAEFGLGATGREAILRYPLLPLVAHCAQDN